MKSMVFILFLISIKFGLGQSGKQIIGTTKFDFVLSTKDDTIQAEFLTIYQNKKEILKHTISKFDGDCSSENIELGTYKIKDSTLTLYTYWASADRMGMNIYPYGFRKKIYTVNSKGQLILKQSNLYIESYTNDYKRHPGLIYLKQTPKTKKEKQLLFEYTALVEQMYFGKFVLNNDKIELETEVRKVLHSDLKKHTNYWEESYGNNCKK